MKHVLVKTGRDRNCGLGLAMARAFASRGEAVFGCATSGSGVVPLANSTRHDRLQNPVSCQ